MLSDDDMLLRAQKCIDRQTKSVVEDARLFARYILIRFPELVEENERLKRDNDDLRSEIQTDPLLEPPP